MMVVDVLMINCQVSLKWKKGPDTAQITMSRSAIWNVRGRPAALASPWEKVSNFICKPLSGRYILDTTYDLKFFFTVTFLSRFERWP